MVYKNHQTDKKTLSRPRFAKYQNFQNHCLSTQNHSIRATAITEMDEAGIDTRHIMRVSGHKSETSIKHYTSWLCEKKKRKYQIVEVKS